MCVSGLFIGFLLCGKWLDHWWIQCKSKWQQYIMYRLCEQPCKVCYNSLEMVDNFLVAHLHIINTICCIIILNRLLFVFCIWTNSFATQLKTHHSFLLIGFQVFSFIICTAYLNARSCFSSSCPCLCLFTPFFAVQLSKTKQNIYIFMQFLPVSGYSQRNLIRKEICRVSVFANNMHIIQPTHPSPARPHHNHFHFSNWILLTKLVFHATKMQYFLFVSNFI